MNDPALVADASAILALLQNEVFRGFDQQRLVNASISAVNLAEVLTKLRSAGLDDKESESAVDALDLLIVPFDEDQARAAAHLWPLTKRVGLSLADRACLSLGIRLGKPVVTADRVWGTIDIGAEILLIR